MVTDIATVTMESLQETIALSNGAIADPYEYDLPFPQNGGSICPQDTRMAISATGDPINFMFGSRVGFSGTMDLMALFSIRMNKFKWQPPPSWIISNGHISATAHGLLI